MINYKTKKTKTKTRTRRKRKKENTHREQRTYEEEEEDKTEEEGRRKRQLRKKGHKRRTTNQGVEGEARTQRGHRHEEAGGHGGGVAGVEHAGGGDGEGADGIEVEQHVAQVEVELLGRGEACHGVRRQDVGEERAARREEAVADLWVDETLKGALKGTLKKGK